METKNASLIIDEILKQGVIDPEKLHAVLKDKSAASLKIIDASMPAPGSGRSPRAGFQEKRIAGAQFFDMESVSDHNNPLPHMLPSAEDFARAVSALGISNTDLVVIYGQDGLIMGPARAWWMFRVFGHDNVVVLDGGLPAWLDAWYPVEMTPPVAPNPAPGNFTAHYRPALVVDRHKVQEAIGSTTMILDARPQMRFSGETPEPRPSLACGHIPGSINIPAVALVDIDTKKLKDAEIIADMANFYGIKDSCEIIVTCGSGVTACVIALALYRIGYANIAVYDGSWAEWGQKSAALPVAVGL